MTQPSVLLLLGMDGTAATLTLLGLGDVNVVVPYRTTTATGKQDSPVALTGMNT